MNKEFTINPILRRLLPFIMGLVGAMVMAFFQQVNFHPVQMVSSFFEREEITLPVEDDKVEDKLKTKTNSFKLKNGPIFPQAYGEDLNIGAFAYGAVDLDSGEVYAQKNISKPLPIASITKIMTAIVALDLAKADEEFRVSKNASGITPTKIGVVPNQKMNLSELLNALLLTSANDAAQVILEGVNEKYGKDVFVDAMNFKAKLLGLKNTSFSNPQGFDSKKNYSSVEDLAVLSNYALKNYPEIKEIVKKDYEFLPKDDRHKQFDLYNWNGLLGVYPGVTGFKIGNTQAAGYTTVVVSEREGKEIVSVVLGAPDVVRRDLWAAELLDGGFKKSLNLSPEKVTELELKAKYSGWKYWN